MTEPAPKSLPPTDPYATLGLPPSASMAEIKQAYFAQVRAHPPERDPQAFKQIRAAYDQLKTPEKRFENDMLRLEVWPEPPLVAPVPLDFSVSSVDVLQAARGLSDLARGDWREDFREVKL